MNQSELEAVVLQLQETTPTLEEQWFAIGVQGWVDSAGNITRSVGGHRTTIMVAPVACRILSVVSSFEYFACPASDTDYWSIGLEKGSGTSFPNITTKSTQVTGANANGGIVGRTAWWEWVAAVASTALGPVVLVSHYPPDRTWRGDPRERATPSSCAE